MLKKVAEGVLIHESECIQSNSVIVHGNAGALLIDAGLTNDEMVTIANDLRESGQHVIAGFSTHPHWDHVLWHTKLGKAPRYGTARCAAAAKAVLSNPGWKDDIAEELPPEVAEQVPLSDLFGQITGLPAKTTYIPWDGPKVRIIEHQAHAPGHAGLLVENAKVLVAGDMLSDVLIPMLDWSAADPIEDYLNGLQLLEEIADDVAFFIPGHGSVGGGEELRERIELDRTYVQALRDNQTVSDPRIGAAAKEGWEWVSDVHAGQLQQLAKRREHKKNERK